MSISPTDVHYFLAVAQHGHFGRAANECGISQPAMTKALKRLEETTGVTLIERGTQGARLTSEGQLFLESARRFMTQHDDLIRTASELRAQHAGLLRLGLTNPAGDSAVVATLSEMIRQRPGMRVQLTIGKSDALNTAVEAGTLDIAIAPAFPEAALSCSQFTVSDDKVRVAARVGHPIFQDKYPTLATLAPYFWIMPSQRSASRRMVHMLYEKAALALPRVAVEAEFTSDAVLGLVASTDLLALIPARSLKSWAGKIAPIPIPELSMQRHIVLLTRHDARWSPLMTEFRNRLHEGSLANG